MPVPAQLDASAAMQTLSVAAAKLNALSLKQKITWLRQHRADDPLDQMQSDAIADLYDAVVQIQQAIWPLLLIIPDTSGARDAAGANCAVVSARMAMPPGRRF